MSEYIISDEQLAAIVAKCGVNLVNPDGTLFCDLKGVAEVVDKPITLKEIVRCRDCRYYECGDDGWWCLRSISTKSNHPDGFCKWGEKR